MLASAIRSSITVVASSVCSDSVALASVASSAWAMAVFSSIRRRTWPQMSSVQLAVPSRLPEVPAAATARWLPVVPARPVVPVLPAPVVCQRCCWNIRTADPVHRAGHADDREELCPCDLYLGQRLLVVGVVLAHRLVRTPPPSARADRAADRGSRSTSRPWAPRPRALPRPLGRSLSGCSLYCSGTGTSGRW